MTTVSELITREFNMPNYKVEHDKAYSFVVDYLGAERLRKIFLSKVEDLSKLVKAYQKDRHLNNYPARRDNLQWWDNLGIAMINNRLGYSLCDATCIAKQVAKQIAEEALQGTAL